MNAFNEVKKTISPYMRSRGFVLSGGNFYYISNDIAYCVALDAPGGLIYATAYVMPLYIPCQNRYYTYGNRLNALKDFPLQVLQKADDTRKRNEWCNMFCRCIEKRLIPFYNEIGAPDKLVECAEHKSYGFTSYIHCPEVFVERLKMYSYLYLRNIPKTKTAMKRYRELLLNSTFFTNVVRQTYLNEVDVLETLLDGDEQDIFVFCQNTMDNSKKVL